MPVLIENIPNLENIVQISRFLVLSTRPKNIARQMNLVRSKTVPQSVQPLYLDWKEANLFSSVSFSYSTIRIVIVFNFHFCKSEFEESNIRKLSNIASNQNEELMDALFEENKI